MTWNNSPSKTFVVKGLCKICKEPFERKCHSGNAARINRCGAIACDKEAKRRASREHRERAKWINHAVWQNLND